MNTIKHRNGTVQTAHKGKVTWAVKIALAGGDLDEALDRVKASDIDREAAREVFQGTLKRIATAVSNAA